MTTLVGRALRSPVSVVLLLLAVAPLYVVNLNGWLTEDDEGAYVYTAWRMAEGEPLYSGVSSTKPPVSLLAAAALFRAVGPDLAAARALGVAMVALAGLGLYFAGRRLGGPACGFLAAGMLFFHPDVIRAGRFFRPDSFLLAASAATYVALLAAIGRRSTVLFAVAGVLGSIALLSKFSGGLVLIAVAIAVWSVRSCGIGPRAHRAFLVGALGTLGIAAAALWIAAPDFLVQTAGHQLRQTGDQAFLGRAVNGFRFLLTRLLQNYPVTVPAIALTVFAYRRRPAWFPERALAAIFPTMLLLLLIGRQLFARHYFVYLPALSLLAARALTLPGAPMLRRAQAVGLVVLAGWFGFMNIDVLGRIRASESETLVLAERIRDLTAPGDVVFGDYAEINFHARRKGTPLTSRLSRGALQSGEITTDRLIRDLVASEVKLVFVRVRTDQARKTRDGVNPSPHLLTVPDFERLLLYLEKNYRRAGEVKRGGQVFRLFVRP